jgi:hypothetical protein
MHRWILSILLNLSFAVVAGEAQAGTNLDVLLNDALYALNRYQELSAGFDCNMYRDKDLQSSCTRANRVIENNVGSIKLTLIRVSKSQTPADVDLLDIYSELVEVAGRLEDFSASASEFAHEETASTLYAAASDKTNVLAAKLYVELRKRIEAHERACRS